MQLAQGISWLHYNEPLSRISSLLTLTFRLRHSEHDNACRGLFILVVMVDEIVMAFGVRPNSHTTLGSRYVIGTWEQATRESYARDSIYLIKCLKECMYAQA